MSTITLRQQLLRAGFAPIPLRGKIPAPKAWQTKTATNDQEVALWEQSYPDATNTGILTRLAPAIDIDIVHPEAAEAVETLAREHFEERGNILVRIGKAPKRAILLRTDEPFAKITRNVVAPDGSEQKIELLCDGQQLVAYGIHPDTGRPYTWHGGQPGETALDDLPYVNEEQATAFMNVAAELLISDFEFKAADDRPKQRTNGRDSSGG